MPYLYPDSDLGIGNWRTDTGSGANLYASINEEPASDANYIEAGSMVYPANEIYRSTFTNPSGAVGAGNLICRVRWQVVNWVDDVVNINFSVLDSSNNSAGTVGFNSGNMLTTWGYSSFLCNDYLGIDLNDIQFRATMTGGGDDTGLAIQISQVRFEYPAGVDKKPATINGKIIKVGNQIIRI